MSTVSILNDLITICKDGEQGFIKIAEEVVDRRLQTIFLERAKSCATDAQQLQSHVATMGHEPTDSGSVLGMLHRGWIDIKSTVTDRNTYDILDECEKGEDAAKQAYSKALESELPDDVRALIQEQYEGVKENHDIVRDLRDEYAQTE